MLQFLRIKTLISHKYYPWLLACLVFFVGIILSLFRFAEKDETGYLLEASLIANSIRNFEWIGNLPVGLHGFLTKILAALLFLITGNSVAGATIINVIFASFCAFFIYLINLEIIASPRWSLAGAFLAISSYYFIYTIPTFLRDIPALFSVLLLVYLLLQNSHFLLIGLAMLFVLDCKEYLFFILSVPIFVYLALISFSETKKRFLHRLGYFIKNILLVFSPALLFIVLMFSTNLIPANNYLAFILGMSPKGIKHSFSEFTIARATATNKPEDKARFVEKEENQRKIYVDKYAYEAFTETFRHIEHNSRILAITTEINSELTKMLPEDRVIPYFYSLFPEKKLRKAESEELVLEILNKFNIGAVVVYPELKANKYYLASKLPRMLQEEKYFIKIQFPLETGFDIFVLKEKHKALSETETVASRNLQEEIIKNKEAKIEKNPEDSSRVMATNAILKYFRKISSPRVFSFLSVPLIVIFPAFVMSLSHLKKIKSQPVEAFLALFVIFFITIYVLRASHGRYLLPVMPIIYLFFIKSLKSVYEEKPVSLRIGLLLALPFIILSIFEENSNKIAKSAGYIFFTLLLACIAFYPIRTGKIKQAKKLLLLLFLAAFPLFTFVSAVYASYKIGQLGRYIRFGDNCEFRKIAKEFSPNEKIWFNGDINLLSFYRNDNYIEPKQPRGARFKSRSKNISERKRSFYFVQDSDSLRDSFSRLGIKTVALLVASPQSGLKFSRQDEYLKIFLASSWLEQKKIMEFKNKTLYIFSSKDK